MRDSDSNKLRPIDAFVKYFLDVKPYHTKLLEVVERYKFAEDIPVVMEDTMFAGISIRNTPLCKAVGFGLIFDECGFSNDSCCDLFQCLGGYGIIWDNSDLVADYEIESFDPVTDELVVSGNYVADQRLEILRVETNSLTLRGNQVAQFDNHRLFLIAPFNVYSILDAYDNVLIVQGDVSLELNTKKEIRVAGTRGRDALYGVHKAIFNEVEGYTEVTIAGSANFNVSVDGARIETEAQPRNQGFYPVDRAEEVNGDTVVFLRSGFSFPVQTNKDNGSVQLRTALSAPRRIWLVDVNTGTEVDPELKREYRISDSFYDAENDKTIFILADKLFSGENYTNVRIYGYLTGSGFDGEEECDQPKPTNIHAVMGEGLWMCVTDIVTSIEEF